LQIKEAGLHKYNCQLGFLIITRGVSMELQKNFQEIKTQLAELGKNIADIFGNKIERIQTIEIKEKLTHYVQTEVEKIKKEIEYGIKVLESPIYAGFLGRYSHGKTALVNKLFSIEEDFSLPEGEGIVTSKITRVEFDGNVITPKCYECNRNGDKSQIDIVSLKENVSGKKTDDNSLIDYYYMKMPSSKPFAKTFENKMINLIDMPGLGGLYFKDTEKTRKYIESLDMLLIIIKITEVENAGKVIEPFISGIKINMIPILTFFDKWGESNKFADCKDGEDVIGKAREQIKEYIPSLDKHLTKLIAVSSLDGFQIDNLRELILNFVEEQNFAIEKIKKEGTEVFKRKIRELEKVLQSIIVKTEASIEKLKKNIESLLPEKGDFASFNKHFTKNRDKFTRDAKTKITRATKEVFSKFRDKTNEVRYKNSYTEINNFLGKLKNDINNDSMKDLKEDITVFFAEFKDKLGSELEKFIDRLELDKQKGGDLKENCLDIIRDYQIDLYDVQYEPPETASDMIKDYGKSVAETILVQLKNPQFLLPLGIGVLLIVFGGNLPWKFGEYSSIFGWVLVIANVAFLFIMDNSTKKKHFNDAKNNIMDKLTASLDRQKLEENAYTSLTRSANDLLDEVDSILNEDISTYGRDLKIVKDVSREFKATIDNLNKYLSNEIEKMEMSQ
jgi:hypothetical protein